MLQHLFTYVFWRENHIAKQFLVHKSHTRTELHEISYFMIDFMQPIMAIYMGYNRHHIIYNCQGYVSLLLKVLIIYYVCSYVLCICIFTMQLFTIYVCTIHVYTVLVQYSSCTQVPLSCACNTCTYLLSVICLDKFLNTNGVELQIQNLAYIASEQNQQWQKIY